MLLAYFGPETFLPMTSAIAAVVGVLLMFGRTSIRFALDAVRRAGRIVGLGGKTQASSGVPSRPHVSVSRAAQSQTADTVHH